MAYCKKDCEHCTNQYCVDVLFEGLPDEIAEDLAAELEEDIE